MKKEIYLKPDLELHKFQIERPFCDSAGTDSLDDFGLLDDTGLTWDEELFI